MSVIQSLSPELIASMKARVTKTLAGIVKKNATTMYATEGPLMSSFHAKFTSHTASGGSLDPDDILPIFTSTIPLSTYEDYVPYISRLFETPCKASRISNLLSPGLPVFVAHSSGTTGGAAKTFPKYVLQDIIPLPRNETVEGITVCMILSLFYSRFLDVEDDRAESEDERITLPMGTYTVAAFRAHQGITLHDDPSLMTRRLPSYNTSPHAVALVKLYRTMLLMHGLFAIKNPSVNLLYSAFGTVMHDFIRLLEEEWETLLQAIDDGKLPEYEGLETVGVYLQTALTPDPSRAAELRRIKVGAEGWLKEVWPNFEVFRAIVSGPYSRVLPKLHHDFGPTVRVHNPLYGATEAFAAEGFLPGSIDVFKMWHPEYYEFLDIEMPEDALGLRHAWELEAGKKYELVVTTRDGLWRYRIGDVIEIIGFDAADGQPAIKFSSRRNVMIRVSGCQLKESELSDVISLLKGIIGHITEYTTIIDDRKVPHSLGFLVELETISDIISTSSSSSIGSTLHTHLTRMSESYRTAASSRRHAEPTVRVLAPGTFSAYRGWRMEVVGSAGGQIKVPAVVEDEATVNWLLERVVKEFF